MGRSERADADRGGPGARRPWWPALLAAMAAALLAWAAGEAALDAFRPSADEAASGVATFGTTDRSALIRGERRAAARNAALHYAILGAATGLGLGLAGGASRRSWRGAVLGAECGGVAGGLAAGLVGLGTAAAFHSAYSQDDPNLLLPLFAHGLTWAAAGAAAGAALALGAGSRVGGPALGGALAALAAAVVYEVAYAVAFPLAEGGSLVPDSATVRLLSHVLVAASIALGATRAVGPRPADAS